VKHAACIVLIGILLSLNIGATGRETQRRRASVLIMEATAYCVEGETASGTQTRRGVVAADPAVLPLGSVIRIGGLRGSNNGQYRVEDTGRTVKGHSIDIFVEDCATAKRFGRQQARVRILERGKARR
jgi:rare lipoprotein A